MKDHVPKNILYRFAFSKITVIVLFALLCAGLTVYVANDMFAFVKPSKVIEFEISEPIPLNDICLQLQDLGVIENSLAFQTYVTLKKQEAHFESFYGSLDLNSNMSYRDILNKFKYF